MTICPLCSAEVTVQTICTWPPTTCYRCTKCDYHYDVRDKLEDVKIVAPLPPEKEKE